MENKQSTTVVHTTKVAMLYFICSWNVNKNTQNRQNIFVSKRNMRNLIIITKDQDKIMITFINDWY